MSSSPDDPWEPDARALLEARTRAVALPAIAPAPLGQTELLRLRVGGEPYALPAASVRAVAALARLTPLPHAPPEVAGLTARGGHVLPVFHLRAVLGLPLAALPEFGRIVLLGDGDEALALAVDAVEGTAHAALDALREPPLTMGPDTRALVRGVGPDGVPVLDPDALLASPRLVVDVPLPRGDRR